jgi:nicotinamidase-related amidase
MESTALLIIDMQVGAAELKNPAFYQMDALIARLQNLLGKAREKGIPIYYARHHNPGGFPEYGSHAWQILPQLAPQEGDSIVDKSTPDVFLHTPLHAQLQHHQIERLVIGGIQTADCIDTTCRRASSLGYQVLLLKDGHTTFDTPVLKAEQIIAHHNSIIQNWFGEVVETEKINF